jgi:hypothetical protein
MSLDDVVVLSAARTPFGKFGGSLRDFTLPQLGGKVVAEVIRRAGIEPADVDEVRFSSRRGSRRSGWPTPSTEPAARLLQPSRSPPDRSASTTPPSPLRVALRT